jgi:hypothetical protein
MRQDATVPDDDDHDRRVCGAAPPTAALPTALVTATPDRTAS